MSSNGFPLGYTTRCILTGCTFIGNVGTNGAGALANAVGATVMTVDSCTVTGNIAGSNGGGIWNGGTLNMKGAVKVIGNHPEFFGVTISNTSTSENAVDAGMITFKGQYDAQHIGEDGDSTLLYLGTYSTFRYPDGEMIIGSCRAYFRVKPDLGDVNGDGEVNITDVTVLINYLLTDDASFIVIEKADINGDGDINITDVTALVNILLGDNCMINNINVWSMVPRDLPLAVSVADRQD